MTDTANTPIEDDGGPTPEDLLAEFIPMELPRGESLGENEPQGSGTMTQEESDRWRDAQRDNKGFDQLMEESPTFPRASRPPLALPDAPESMTVVEYAETVLPSNVEVDTLFDYVQDRLSTHMHPVRLTIGSGCGEDCRTAIDNAAVLIKFLENLVPDVPLLDNDGIEYSGPCDFRKEVTKAIVKATSTACDIYYYG